MPPELSPSPEGREMSCVMPDDIQQQQKEDEESLNSKKESMGETSDDNDYYLENSYAIIYFSIGSSFLLGVSISDMISMDYTTPALRFLAPVFYLFSGLNLVLISKNQKELYSATAFSLASLADSISVLAGLETDSREEEIFLLFASHLYFLYGVWTLCWRRNRYRKLTLRKTAVFSDVMFLVGSIINLVISYFILDKDISKSSQITRDCGFASAVFWFLNSIIAIAVYGVERFLGQKPTTNMTLKDTNAPIV
mmetsp:Transcript_20344/g.23223  ORF Transcript_20344/g.23223 Transcript_20344/m.23223 type:complete len:253 (+) Transcript_20344:107-865(+)|eukprot:CAMPEP_0194130266 /NCGR_PEP_ID=MMETSP0152-20130528/1337_1 /TAXON_ID=1049557 /ORGANISM="Thalassiothrix antarctica, Strain L6-D1" /LENGTH=252 /DNA_ID=CAMNT_0038824719 /DNA_START=107 /DNA_END=865 /DNA_ORIENTATION=+